MKNKLKIMVQWDGYHWWAQCKSLNILVSGNSIGESLMDLNYWIKQDCEEQINKKNW